MLISVSQSKSIEKSIGVIFFKGIREFGSVHNAFVKGLYPVSFVEL